MNAKAYNLLWVAPKFPPPGATELYQPIPDDTVKNMLGIAQRNADVDVQLWVDSKRYTEPQMEWLGAMTAKNSEGNMSLQDLRTMPTYDQNAFYNEPDNSESWRFDKSSLIWRQVDAARVLVCLQGDYEQSFYSDGDVTNLNINSEEIQKRIKKDGVVLSGWVSDNGFPMYENQMFGFNRERRALFKGLYENTIHNAMTKGENGYASYIDFINQELKDKAGIDTREVVFESRHDGTVALHPGEQVRPTDLPPAEGSGWRK